MVAALRITPCEEGFTYYASVTGNTITLSRYDDQAVCDICHGKIHTPEAGEQFIFPVEHLREVITTLCEVYQKQKSS